MLSATVKPLMSLPWPAWTNPVKLPMAILRRIAPKSQQRAVSARQSHRWRTWALCAKSAFFNQDHLAFKRDAFFKAPCEKSRADRQIHWLQSSHGLKLFFRDRNFLFDPQLLRWSGTTDVPVALPYRRTSCGHCDATMCQLHSVRLDRMQVNERHIRDIAASLLPAS